MATRTYRAGDRVEARKDLKNGEVKQGTAGKVTADQHSNTVRVKFQRDPYAYRVVEQDEIRLVSPV